MTETSPLLQSLAKGKKGPGLHGPAGQGAVVMPAVAAARPQ